MRAASIVGAILLGPLMASCAQPVENSRPRLSPVRPGAALVFRTPETLAQDREAGVISEIEHAEYARRDRELGVRRVRKLPPEPSRASDPLLELLPPGRPNLWYVW